MPPEETDHGKAALSTTAEIGFDIDEAYNMTLKQLAYRANKFDVGTAMDFDTLNSVGDEPVALLYGAVAATEFSMIMDTRVCNMYSIAKGFDPSKWDYKRC